MVLRTGKKKRWVADLVADFGLNVLDEPGLDDERGYLTTFALYLLAGRINSRRSFVILDGVKGALSPTIDKHFFDAMFENEDEAEFYHGLHEDRVKFWLRKRRGAESLASHLGEAGGF